MSLKETGASCALCHAYLFEEDDVVYCPICGAPHHRECYNSIGHCALESSHGTENQYDILKEKEKNSPAKNQPTVEQITENTPKDDTYTPGDEIFAMLPPIDFLGGVPADDIIEDGITAKEARNFVISNTQRYIPKFKKLSKKNKISWNFLAFFFPHAWLLSRKMYKQGIILTIFMLVSKLLIIPFANNLNNIGYDPTASYSEMVKFLSENMNQINATAVLVGFAGACLYFGLKLLVAIFGDYWYRQHSIAKIKEIKETSDNIAEDYKKFGGVNLFMFLLGVMATMYLPAIIQIFIG